MQLFPSVDYKLSWNAVKEKWLEDHAIEHFDERMEEVAKVYNLGEVPFPTSVSDDAAEKSIGKVFFFGYTVESGQDNEAVKERGWSKPGRIPNERYFVGCGIGRVKITKEKGKVAYWVN